jgi:hypothetical protein
LHHALVFAGGGDDEFALAQVVAAGLLDIDMLAGGAGEDGGGRVPVIRRGNGNGVHVGIIQDAAKVLHSLWRALLLFGDGSYAFLDGPAVHVTDVANLGVRQSQIAGDMIHPAAIATDDGDHDLLVRALGRPQ